MSDNVNEEVSGKQSLTAYQFHVLDPAIIRTVREYPPGACTKSELREHLRKNPWLDELDSRLDALVHATYCSTKPGAREGSTVVVLSELPYPPEYERTARAVKQVPIEKLIAQHDKVSKLLTERKDNLLDETLLVPEVGLLESRQRELHDEILFRHTAEMNADPRIQEVADLKAQVETLTAEVSRLTTANEELAAGRAVLVAQTTPTPEPDPTPTPELTTNEDTTEVDGLLL